VEQLTAMPETEPLRVATLNMLFDLTFWPERAPLVLEGFRGLRPHVIALQEVSPQIDNARWLADQLGGYTVYSCSAQDHRASDHLALLTRVQAEGHSILPLGAEGRQAHRVAVEHGGTRWTVVNTHFCWNPLRESVRVEQARRLLTWLQGEHPAIVCGDFNARPGARSQRVLADRFASAHRVANGRDPHYTYPTSLRRGPGLRHAARAAFFRIHGRLSTQHDGPWRTTVDHVFVDRDVVVTGCRVAFDQPADDDPPMYASDHLGLVADLERRRG
jgi:endonuclease/exonuclease/phosphatase family metal-dependent hydrolase